MTEGNRSPRPDAITVDPDGVPETLRERDLWLVWRYEWQDDRDEWAKVPKDGAGGNYRIDATDPDNGVAFDTAVETYQTADDDGLGIITDPDDMLVGLDWDDVRDPDRPHESVPDLIAEMIETLDSYIEVSPSEGGYRGFAVGAKPDGPNRADLPCEPVLEETPHIEVYDGSGGRYLTVTGQHVPGTPETVETRPQEVTELYEEHIAGDEPPKPTGDGGIVADENDATPRVDTDIQDSGAGGTDLTDEELLQRAKTAENGDKFRRLWDGQISGYPSQSEADLALCGHLAFWTGGDRRQIDRLFRDSALYRDKWDRDDYRQRTINKALTGMNEFYDPNHDGGPPSTPDVSTDTTDTDGTDPVSKFTDACHDYQIDPGRVATESHNGETVTVGVSAIVPDSSIGDAVLAFNRNADLLDGTDRQAVIGAVILSDLQDCGEFFKTTAGELYYFHDPEATVYRVDGDRRVLTEDFQALVWERYNLLSGNFSRNLGKDIKSQARRHAPERAVYRFAHYDTDAGALYISDFGNGYYAITPGAVEWRQNGTDVFFLSNERATPFEYLDADNRPELPAEIPGERPLWCGHGDAVMRLFGNRVNYDENAALAPADQRNQLYIHLHTLPFIDVLNARPIMAWVGEKGSGKTVLQRSIGRFIYGDEFTESVMPDGKDDFLAKVTNQALAFLDNYDDGVGWANDILAAVATGAGIDLRELFTTNDLHQEVPRCWLSLTSRDPPFRRDDVADRTLVFRVERVEDGFVGMGDYLRQVTAYRDLLWSVYLDNLQQIVRTYHERDTGAMSSDHRMADWAIFARIVGEALDVDAVDDLLETMETERATFALENEPWARVLGRWIEEKPEQAAKYRSAGDLADELQTTSDDHDLPLDVTHAAGLGSKLTTYREELDELYDLEIDDSGRSNQYRFATDHDDHDPTGLGRYS